MPLPLGASIDQVHVLHRHGSRYPTTDAHAVKFGKALASQIKAGTASNFSGALSFLNSWSYKLGYELGPVYSRTMHYGTMLSFSRAEILVPVGRQE